MSSQISPALPEQEQSGRRSYEQALRSTASIGGATVVTVILGVIRTKVVAALLGPSGIGLLGAYSAITSMVATVAGMGIQNSGVREISQAAGRGDPGSIMPVAIALRRVTLVLALVGGLLMLALSPLLSAWTFGTAEHTAALALLSAEVVFVLVSGGQLALLQGLRRIGDLVRVKVVGALLGTALSIPLVLSLGIKGLAPLMVTVAATGLAVSWWYARRADIGRCRQTWKQTIGACRPMLRLGLAFMASGVLTFLTAYLLRVIIMRRLGIEAAGHYQVAATLASVYVGFVLTAMGTDFYPRLTAVADDSVAMVRMLNEQTEVALLLGTAGMLATMAFAPLVVLIFYSGRFDDAVDVLRWQVLGVALRVISWPLGFAVLAKGRAKVFFWTELAACAVHIGAIWLGLEWFGLNGTGMAYLALYAFYWAMMYFVVRRMLGFAYSRDSLRLLARTVLGLAVVSASTWTLPAYWSMAVGLVITVVVGWRSLGELAALSPDLPAAAAWNRVRRRLRLPEIDGR